MSRFDREFPATVRPRTVADLVAGGVSRHALETARWRRAARGYYVPASDVASSPAQRIVEAAAVAPAAGAVGGWAAAYAWGADLLDGLDDYTMRPLPVVICVPPGGHRVSTAGLTYRQQRLGEDEVRTRAGLRFTSPARTASDLLHAAASLTEAVVALDAMAAAGVPITALSLPFGRRGARQARQAVELSRTGVRSTWETRLRLLYVLELRFPTPLVNQPVYDLEGRLLGVPDLLDVEAGLVLEFDGVRWPGSSVAAGHRDRDQHRADNHREELFERAGLTVVRADGRDVGYYQRRLMGRIQAARKDGLARDRSRDRWVVGTSRRFSRPDRPLERENLLPGRPRLIS